MEITDVHTINDSSCCISVTIYDKKEDYYSPFDLVFGKSSETISLSPKELRELIRYFNTLLKVYNTRSLPTK